MKDTWKLLYFIMSPSTSSHPEKYVLFMILCSKKHQTATGTLCTITTGYNFCKPLAGMGFSFANKN